ncbi:hypothetical protein Pla110_07810 [Polystyrenella longa]|uniref:Uncharacterized protein n=1 Tax=Polystyrenella longa TaxID=2528007 RepID=A0A518CIR0_9PLAN|nr:hypothetical protein [Polystyrenella longa]QDU79077.1 hypothetical protein Pla110_07810 [Polystyrenella longa]
MLDSFSPWPEEAYTIWLEGCHASQIAETAYERTCRTDYSEPGFCLIQLDRSYDSRTLRQFMLQLKDAMSQLHLSKRGEQLRYLSATRFDQQNTTKPHVDGGPEECFLMLGYEPTSIKSQMQLIDYTRCAFERDLTPNDLLHQFNPMYANGAEILAPYTTKVSSFAEDKNQVFCINNSTATFSSSRPAWQGLLHSATINEPDLSQRRVINSTLIGSFPINTDQGLSNEKLSNFLQSDSLAEY